MVIKHKLLHERCAANVEKLNNNDDVWIKSDNVEEKSNDSNELNFESASDSQSVSAMSALSDST